MVASTEPTTEAREGGEGHAGLAPGYDGRARWGVSVTVRSTGRIEQWARDMASGAPRAAELALEATLGPVVEDARDRWPVETGRSRAGLDLAVRPTSGGASASVTDEAPYTKMIKLRSGVRPWRDYIRKAGAEAVAEMGPEILRALREEGRNG